MADSTVSKKSRILPLHVIAALVLIGCAINVLSFCRSLRCNVKGYPTLSEIADRTDNVDLPRRNFMATLQQALHCVVAAGFVYAVVLINARIREQQGAPVPVFLAIMSAATLLYVTFVANNHNSLTHAAGFAVFLLLTVYIGWLVNKTLKDERNVLSLSLVCIVVFLTVAFIINMLNGWSEVTNPAQRSIIAFLEYAVVIVVFVAVCRLV
jgi:hypothetical protein